MCGIVGYLGPQQAESILLEGLSRLEYRGYDSAGVATIEGGASHIVRAEGKLVNLRDRLRDAPCPGTIGIGHTRWATHGAPTEANAHPHHADGITVVHNGILENHVELRADLSAKGREFTSDTDTEIFAHLIALARQTQPTLLDALREALTVTRGAYALAVTENSSPDRIVFAKQSSPLVVGLGEDENFLASDVPAVLTHTRRFIFLDDGDLGEITASGVRIENGGETVERPMRNIDWSPVMAEKGGHKHFMHKEIFEQPRAITDTLRGRLLFEEARVGLDGVDDAILENAQRLTIVACGTSYHAGLVGRYLFEKLARMRCDVELASELRYREPVLGEGDLVIAISQSGETADTLAALKEAEARGAQRMAICNVIDSAIPRSCEKSAGTLYTRAGPEIGVASTKAFVTQLVALHLIAISLGQRRGTLSREDVINEMTALSRLPREVEELLENEEDIKQTAKDFMNAQNMLYLGRGLLFPIALEGALKLKEISYIHAEGYAAGEMKHGPIALIDEELPVVVLAPTGATYEKVVSNLEEVRARGGRIVSVCHDDDARLREISEAVMLVPHEHEHITPTLATIPLQLFAYHVADLRGTDVDQPRNLAKSVTVE
jgi:glucosamine--fructose-6-phosphate aminotransferase (isomerizing)